jgi:Histidine kinase
MTNWRKIELTFYILTIIIILSFPFFDHPSYTQNYWAFVLRDVKRFLPFIILFFVNAEFLVPRYLLKKKYITYFSSILFAISFVLAISFGLSNAERIDPMGQPGIQNRPRHLPPQFQQNQNHKPPQEFQRPPQPFQNQVPPRKLNIWFFNQILLNILVIGLGTGIKMSYSWVQNEQARKDLEKENLKSELAFLKTQISPHFFLNTLNNIHALTDFDVKEAQKAILELSKMMRYLLYESEQGNTTLVKEIEFLKSYIELMRRRIDDKVKIEIKFPEEIEDVSIPPLLFISFIENAFKYGVSYKFDSYIHIELMLISKHELLFVCTNSQHVNEVQKTKASGIGLVNIKKRLNLLFNEDYSLSIEEGEKEYKAILKIPIV